MKPAAMAKASVALALYFSSTSIAMTMGVRIRAAPSLAKIEATAAPRSTIRANRSLPRPPPQRATCRAAHSKKPARSKSRLIMITATNAAVAFQTIPQTVGMSPR